MSHHRIHPRGVKAVGDLPLCVSARCPSGCAAHCCDADPQTRQSNYQRRTLPQQIKEMAACRIFKTTHRCQRKPQDKKRRVAPPPKQPVARSFKMLGNSHGVAVDKNGGSGLCASTLVHKECFHGALDERLAEGSNSVGLCSPSSKSPNACCACPRAPRRASVVSASCI